MRKLWFITRRDSSVVYSRSTLTRCTGTRLKHRVIINYFQQNDLETHRIKDIKHFLKYKKNWRSGASILLQAQMHIAEGRIESLSFELHGNSVNEWSQIFPEKNLLNSCTYMTEMSKQISILYGSFITLLLSHPNAKTLIWSQIVLLTTTVG